MVCYLKARCQAGSMAPVCFSNKNPTMVLERPGGRPVVCSFFYVSRVSLKAQRRPAPRRRFSLKTYPGVWSTHQNLGLAAAKPEFGRCQTRVWQLPNLRLAAAKPQSVVRSLPPHLEKDIYSIIFYTLHIIHYILYYIFDIVFFLFDATCDILK